MLAVAYKHKLAILAKFCDRYTKLEEDDRPTDDEEIYLKKREAARADIERQVRRIIAEHGHFGQSQIKAFTDNHELRWLLSHIVAKTLDEAKPAPPAFTLKGPRPEIEGSW